MRLSSTQTNQSLDFALIRDRDYEQCNSFTAQQGGRNSHLRTTVPMPYTLNGIGTRFYGKRDLRPDGSYITTEWVTFAYVPLVPFRSFRVSYLGPGAGLSETYQIIDR